MNPYLLRKRAQFEAIRTTIEGLQARAATEDRDLTPEELRSVTEQGEQAKVIAAEIESLTDIETRSAAVATLAANLADPAATSAVTSGASQGGQTRSASSTTTRDRDPGHYRSAAQGGQHSFFGDLYRAKVGGDEDAARRQLEHNRALTTGSHGPGIVAPHWLTEEFEFLARQGRVLPVRTIPLGDDPRPITLPKQIAGTDAVVAEQATENTAVGGADAWDSDVDTVTPKPTAGKQTVSRQMIDMSSPAVDQLIYGDLLDVFNNKVEVKIGAGLITAAGASVVSLATEAAFTTTAAQDAVIDTAVAVWNARKRPADVLAMGISRWGKFKKLRDTTNRPLIPSGSGGPMNVPGVGSVNFPGQIEEMGIVASDGINSGGSYPDSVLAYRAMDQILFLSNVLRFRFEEVAGPESIVLGVWGYTAFISRQAGKSVKRFQITAA